MVICYLFSFDLSKLAIIFDCFCFFTLLLDYYKEFAIEIAKLLKKNERESFGKLTSTIKEKLDGQLVIKVLGKAKYFFWIQFLMMPLIGLNRQLK